MWWIAAAFATPSAFSVPYGMSSYEQHYGTPHGDVIIGDHDRVQWYTAQGVAQTQDLPWAFVGEHRSLSRPCDKNGDGWDEVWDAGNAGPLPGPPEVRLRDLRTGAEVFRFEAPGGGADYYALPHFACVDLDGDGSAEGVGYAYVPGAARVIVWNSDGTVRSVWPTNDDDSPLFAVGQLDRDPGLEAILPTREIMDLDTGTTQQSLLPTVDPDRVQLFDVDGDGIDERLEFSFAGGWKLVGMGGVVWPTHHQGPARIADFDGDGSAEVVILQYAVGAGVDLHVLDGATGLPRIPPVSARGCGTMVPFDHDGDGIAQVLCADARELMAVTDPVTGTRELFVGQGSYTTVPLAGDLDGDGHDEVLWTPGEIQQRNDRIVLRDAQGAWLDQLALDSVADGRVLSSLHDVDGNGDMEIVRGGRVFDWSPATGVIELASLVPATTALDCVRAVQDLDANGHPDILYDNCSSGRTRLRRLDLSNGTTSTLRTFDTSTPPKIRDFDGDGIYEIVLGEGGTTHVITPTGAPVDTFPGGLWTLPPAQAQLTVGSGATHVLYRWRRRGFVEVTRVTQPGPAVLQDHAGYAAGYIWTRTSGVETVAWSPMSGALHTFSFTGLAEVAIADGIVWGTDGSSGVGVPLP